MYAIVKTGRQAVQSRPGDKINIEKLNIGAWRQGELF